MSRSLLSVSYVLLWALVVAEAVLTRWVLRRTSWAKQFYIELTRRRAENRWLISQFDQWLPNGTLAPEFSAEVLGANRRLGNQQLKGHFSILLFMSDSSESSEVGQNLIDELHVLWHKVEGHIYLVCRPEERECTRVATDSRVIEFSGQEIPVLIDEGGRIARSFVINATPQAVQLDEEGRVRRYGFSPATQHAEEIRLRQTQVTPAHPI